MAAPLIRFRRLIPSAGECSAEQALAGWRDDRAATARGPRVALNMIASVDGRVSVNGRSGPLGGPADRVLFHALRAQADAVMAAAGTVRAERYGPIIRDAAVRDERLLAGLRAQPLAVIASRSLELDPRLPLLDDPDSHVVIVGPASGELAPTRATVDYIRSGSLAEGLAELAARFAVELIVCEGGPSLNASLLGEGLLDELFVAVSPNLVGGALGPGLIAEDREPARLRRLELRMLLESDSELYARYVLVP